MKKENAETTPSKGTKTEPAERARTESTLLLPYRKIDLPKIDLSQYCESELESIRQPVTGKRLKSTAKKENQSATEHFVLFRDLSEPKSRLLSEPGLLLGDMASYAWADVGKLTGLQAKIVRTKLAQEFDELFEKEARDNGWRCSDMNAPYRSSRPLKIPRKDRSFVELLSLPTLRDIWQHVDHDSSTCLLELTAVIWNAKTFGSKYELWVSGEGFSQEEIELFFKSSIADQKLTPCQQEILKKCADIASRVRETDDMDKLAEKAGSAPAPGSRRIKGASRQPQTFVASKQTDKSSHSQTSRKPRESKYEDAVENYLRNLVDAVNRGEKPQAFAINLSSRDIAEALHKTKQFKYIRKGVEFETKIESIEDKVRRTDAWKKWQKQGKQEFLSGVEPPRLDAVYDQREFDPSTGLPDGVDKVDRNEEYDAPVEDFLRALHNKVLTKKMTHEKYCATVSTLTPEVIAKRIKTQGNYPAFEKRSISTISTGVEYSTAWINRMEILDVESYQK